MRIRSVVMGGCAFALLGVGAAGAQPSGPAASSGPDVTTVGEIVVTAERRTMNLQKTPIAVTVLDQTDLIRNGVFTIDQLQFVSPSLAVNDFGQGNDVDIRGIGKGEHNTQTTTGVITYRDGVATFPGYIQEEPYFDIANVEVLRGPQGTFSGQNSTGGAIIVTTRDPVIGGGHDGYLFGWFGNYLDAGLQGAVNMPISSTFAARVAFNLERRDSFYNIAGLTGDPNLYWGSGRLSLLWTPTSSLKVIFKTDYDYLDNGGYFGDAILNPLTGKPNPVTDLFAFSNNYETYATDNFLRSILQVDWVGPDGITFRSISGYQLGRSGWKGDIDGTNLPAPDYIISEKVDETLWSQELDVISPDRGPFSWVLGAYFDANRYDFPPIFDIGVPPGGFDEDLNGVNLTHTYAAFGQASLNLPAGFKLQAGLRYSLWDTSNKVLYYVPEFAPFLNQFQNATERGNNLTGKLALDWQVDPRNFLYVFVATGAKPGGLNTSLYAFPQQAIPAPFRQEYVVDYEAGWKSQIFDDHLRTQIGAYYSRFRNFQVILPLPNNPLFNTEQNDPSATKLYGIEASAQAVLGAFSLETSLGLEKSELGTFFAQDSRVGVGGPCNAITGPASVTCFNLAGHPQTYAPDFTFNVEARYKVRLADGDTVTPSVGFSHISSQWGTLFGNPALGDYLGPRNILGASIAWTHGRFTVTAYGRNLTNEEYISALLSPIRIAGAPRQYGVSVLTKF